MSRHPGGPPRELADGLPRNGLAATAHRCHLLRAAPVGIVRRRKNPLDGLRHVATDAHTTFFRRALDIDELGLLMGATEASGPGGKERATLWAFASCTGMREGEIASLVWADLKDLDGNNPRLEIDASRTKVPKWAGQLIPP